MATPTSSDEVFMREAVRLSRGGFPAPNPHVGAVVVSGGRIVGRGRHAYAGGPHAEALALRRAGDQARGADLYVTLEPCNHTGRTPPCTEAILEAGVRRAVVAVRDPNRQVPGGGVERLREAGLRVEVGLLAAEAERANRRFLHFHRTGRPWVTLKAAMSLDGKIATASGDSKWITDETARRRAQRMRALHGAVLVGADTVLRDDPELTARVPGVRSQPLRIVLDTSLRTPLDARVYNEPPSAVFHCAGSPQKVRDLAARGVRAERVPSRQGQTDPVAVLSALAAWGITGVLVEGGGEVIASFLETGCADAVSLFYAPILIGGRLAKTAVERAGVEAVADAWRLKDVRMSRVGSGWLVEGLLR